MVVPVLAQAVALLAPALVPVGESLPVGWTFRAVRGAAAPTWTMVADVEASRLSVTGRGTAGWAIIPLPQPVPGLASLRWSWRVTRAASQAVLADRRRDDAPIRIVVGFGGSSARPRRVIAYTWGNTEPIGWRRASHQGDAMWVSVVGNATVGGESWHEVTVTPSQDFLDIWGGTPDPITSIALLQDLEDTGDSATAEVRRLDLIPPPRLP